MLLTQINVCHFRKPTLNTSTTFYVQDSTCKASLRTAITVTVIQAPNAPTVTSNNLYVCSGNTATLTASGVYNNLSW